MPLSVVAPRLQGKKFALVGTLNLGARGAVVQLIRYEGGDVASYVTADVDYLLVGATRGGGKPAAHKQAERHNANGSAIAVIDEDAFNALLTPDRDDAIALLRGGPAAVERWNTLCGRRWADVRLDLSGADLRDADLSGAQLTCARLDDADLSGTTLDNAELGDVTGVNFDRARLHTTRLRVATRCTFRDASLERLWCNRAVDCDLDNADCRSSYIDELSGCTARGARLDGGHVSKLHDVDLTGASIRQMHSYYLHAPGCTLRGVDLTEAALANANLAGADLTDANVTGAQLAGVDLRGANIAGVTAHSARMEGADLTGATLTAIDLAGADLANVKLVKADLSRATLTNANLASADLSDAVVDDADFSGANVTGAILDGIDVKRARGLDPARSVGGGIGPNVLRLENVSQKATRLELHAAVDMPDGKRMRLTVHSSATRHGSSCHGYQHGDGEPRYAGNWVKANNLSGCMASMGNKWGHGKLLLDSIRTCSSKSPVKAAPLRDLAIAAWCEAFGVDVPTAADLKRVRAGAQQRRQDLRDQRIALLRTGRKGVREWNAMTLAKRQRPKHYRNADLSGVDLHGIDLSEIDMQGARFDNANLSKSKLRHANLKKASFRDANLRRAEVDWGAKLNDAAFDNADLRNVDFKGVALTRANLAKANVRGATFEQCDLCGANLSSIRHLDDARFTQTRYDSQTALPDGFIPPDGLVWAGVGPDPRIREKVQAKVEAKRAAGPIDIEAFMRDLEQRTDASRLDKALRMLKQSGFQLYADTDDVHVVGVVKSQSDPDLVYACRLTDDGQFSCCTQNLNVCGGLRGSLCKHLLVLIIGLTKAGQLDPAIIDEWVEMSRHRTPQLDKNAMGDVFLRYKGAEAGQVDWRPTETLPEDYYAF